MAFASILFGFVSLVYSYGLKGVIVGAFLIALMLLAMPRGK